MTLEPQRFRSEPDGSSLARIGSLDPDAYATFFEYRAMPEVLFPDTGRDFFEELEAVLKDAEDLAASEDRYDILMEPGFQDWFLAQLTGGYYTNGVMFVNRIDDTYTELITDVIKNRRRLSSEHRASLAKLPDPDPDAIASWMRSRLEASQSRLESYLDVSDALTVQLGYETIGVRIDVTTVLERSKLIRSVLAIDEGSRNPTDADPVGFPVAHPHAWLTDRTAIVMPYLEHLPDDFEETFSVLDNP